MFFIFFYYIFNIFFSKFSEKFVFSFLFKKLFSYSIKIVIIAFRSVSQIKFIPVFILKFSVWIILCILLVFIVSKFSFLISIITSYTFNFKIKYQIFIFSDYKYDPYFILKIIDFIFFYPIFYLYYYFFNDLTFSFQRAYYWIIYKINNFGISQNRRNKFFKNWSYTPAKFEPKRRYDFHVFRSISKLIKKSTKVTYEDFPFIIHLKYYLFFLFIVCLLIYMIYRVYFQELEPIRYDMDDSVRFDFFNSWADQTLKIEFNDFMVERVDNKLDTINRVPWRYIDIENDPDKPIEDENSFDMVMNKFGIDGMSYLDEIRNQQKNINKFSTFNYISFIFYLFKDILESIVVFFQYQIKFNLFFNINNIILFNFSKNKKISNLDLRKKLFYYVFTFFFFMFYVYLFLIILIFLFILTDSDFLNLYILSYNIFHTVDLKLYIIYIQ